MENKEWLTICTPTFNRSHTLSRVYKSLKNQSLKNFIWLIIDDGSVDDTKVLVEKLKKESEFKIFYVYKENGGRHTALNLAYKLIKTEFVLNLDSDDELSDKAIETLYKTYRFIKKRQDYLRFWSITGRCIDSVSNKIISKKFPKNINTLIGKKQHKLITKLYGEKCCCRKVDILKKYPFPEIPGIKFIPEDLVWETINKIYDQYCINDVLRIYHTESEDSLCKGNIHNNTKWKSAYIGYLFYINECFDQIIYNRKVLYAVLNYLRCCHYAGHSFVYGLHNIKNFKKRIVILIISLFGWPLLNIREYIVYIYNFVRG